MRDASLYEFVKSSLKAILVFTRTTQATTVLLLNITKNADTSQNEVAVENLLRENSSSWIEASQILKLISRQSAFC